MEEEKEEDKELHKHSLQRDEDKSLLDDDASSPVRHGDFYHQQHRHRIRKHINDINWKERDPPIDRKLLKELVIRYYMFSMNVNILCKSNYQTVSSLNSKQRILKFYYSSRLSQLVRRHVYKHLDN